MWVGVIISRCGYKRGVTSPPTKILMVSISVKLTRGVFRVTKILVPPARLPDRGLTSKMSARND